MERPSKELGVCMCGNNVAGILPNSCAKGDECESG
jgi:hypothetical protein